jgi:hypothetical protein
VRYMRGRVEFLWSRVTHILDGGGILGGIRHAGPEPRGRRLIVRTRPEFVAETGGRVPPLVLC